MNDERRVRSAAKVLAGALAAATVTLAGCSGGDSWPSAGATSGTPTPSAAAPTSPEASPVAGGTPGSPDNGTGSTGNGSTGGTGGGQPGPGTGSGTGPGGRCTTAELRGSLGQGDGAAGSVNQTLILTNVGKRTCSLRGFPGVSYVGGDNGAQVGAPAEMSGPRGGDVPMAPGASVGAELQLVNVDNFEPATCKPVPVRGLRVYPPGDTASLFVSRPGRGCSGSTPGNYQLSVQTVKAH